MNNSLPSINNANSLKYIDISKANKEQLANLFTVKKEPWFATVSFSKSRSTNFEAALELAKRAPEYNEYITESTLYYQATYEAAPYFRYIARLLAGFSLPS